MPGTHPRALLVDVSEASRDVLVRRLTAQGYLVETAADPATGADMALASPPSVIVADLWMPSISGVQLCRLLRAEPATADVPVILRGPTDDPRSRFWAERAGAAAYVVHATVSIGVASLEASESADSLIDRADRAMYAAKLGGRNRVCVARETIAGASERVLAARSA